MKKIALLFFTMCLVGAAAAANFSTFTRYRITQITKDIVADYGAVCNGSSNAADKTAFDAFKAFAITQPTISLTLTIPSGKTCCWGALTTSNSPFDGVKTLLVSGTGATISLCGSGTSWPFFAAQGMPANNTTNALVQTVSAGSSSVTLVTAGQASRFTSGQWVMLSGGDLQGFGYPPNPFIFEYAKIVNIAGGVITFLTPLQYSYKSTWPVFNSTDSSEGGPATLYALNATFDTDITYSGMTLDMTDNHQGYGAALSLAYLNVTVLGTGCVIPTQNRLWTATNVTMASCGIEVDKLVERSVWTNVTVRSLNVQSSSSSNSMEFNNVTVTNQMTGTPRNFTGVNSSLASVTLGPTSYGAADSFSCVTCVISAISTNPAFELNVDTRYTTVAGVMTHIQTNSTVTNGVTAAGNNVLNFAAVPTGLTFGSLVDDDTAAVIPNSTTVVSFTATTVTLSANVTGGGVGNGDSIRFHNNPPTWAVPGRNAYISSNNWLNIAVFQVTDMALRVVGPTTFLDITTTLPGAIPVAGAFSAAAHAHPAPRFTCSCTGSADAVDLSQTPAGDPIYSYSRRSFTGNLTNQTQPIWGAWTSLKVDVSTAFTGASAMTWTPGQFGVRYVNLAGVATFGSINNTVNVKNANSSGAVRTVLQGATSGALAGDTLTAPGAIWLAREFIGFLNNDASSNSETMSVEIKTNQGVVNP